MHPDALHETPYAGSWYPGDRTELEDLVTRLFAESELRTGRFLAPRPAGFVVPHAGLVYSGTVAAAAWRHIRAAPPERIILIGFAHRGGPKGCWIPDIEAYRTLLGDIQIDKESVDFLVSTGRFGRIPEPAVCDHSIEIQFPLLLHAAPDAKCVPVYVSHLKDEERCAAATHLAALAREGAVLVASSDFTHFGRSFGYHPFPADSRAGERLRELDEGVMEAAGSLRPETFLGSIRSTGATVCGVEPIALLLAALQQLECGGEIFQEALDYQTSGAITGDFTHSVSYAALGFFPHASFELDRSCQQLLLASARETLARYVETGERRPVSPQCSMPGLERRATAFVTLHSDGCLRGCVGRKAGQDPLAKTVPELALSAALDDSRFQPVAPGEAGLEVEISILSPMKLIPDRSCFRVNEHGALIEAGYHHGLLLPQVAAERDWTAEQFFEALARKAGARTNVYDSADTRLSVFRAQIVR